MILTANSQTSSTKGDNVLVAGTGAGGCAVAAYFASRGDSVFLWEPLDIPVPWTGAYTYSGLLGSGAVQTTAYTFDLEAVTSRCPTIVIAARPTALDVLKSKLWPSLSPSQIVICASGGLLSLGLRAGTTRSSESSPLLVELSCFPFSSRFTGPSELTIRGERASLAGIIPATRTNEAISRTPETWIQATTADVLQCALWNPNYVLHPPAVVLNAGSRDREEFVAKEGLTDKAELITQRLDLERLDLLKALGLPAKDLEGLMRDLNQGQRPTTVPIDPEPILDRFISEDVGLGLALYSFLGRAKGLELPVTNAILRICQEVFPDQITPFKADRFQWDCSPASPVTGVANQELVG